MNDSENKVGPYPPLDKRLGQVFVTREAYDVLRVASVTLDDILATHVTGYGGDCDWDYGWDNYDCALQGGPNCSLHDIDYEEELQLRVETAPNGEATVVSLHTQAS